MGCNSSRVVEPAPKWFEDTRGEDSDDDTAAEDGTDPSARGTTRPPSSKRGTELSPSKRRTKKLSSESRTKRRSEMSVDVDSSEMSRDVDSSVVHYSEEVLSAGKPSVSVPSALTVIVPDGSLDNTTSTKFHIVNDQESAPVFFKVKVTHPKVLTFKPNAGRIKPSGTVIITVSFNPGQEAGGAARQPRDAKVMIQTLMVGYTGGNRLPNTTWSEAPPSIVGKNVMKIDFEDPEQEEDIDFSKFRSVTMATKSEKAWWK